MLKTKVKNLPGDNSKLWRVTKPKQKFKATMIDTSVKGILGFDKIYSKTLIYSIVYFRNVKHVIKTFFT